ncbi:MAG: hypothetical protein HC837_12845 [Chloroflexaceae bacterium]|nr:hypothetical protein [Chloroflexaceae bacterium]
MSSSPPSDAKHTPIAGQPDDPLEDELELVPGERIIPSLLRDTTPEIRVFLLSVFAGAIAVWDVGFNLGVYGVIFFDKILAIWVGATATLIVCLIVPREHSPIKPPGLILLLVPSLWPLVSFLFPEETQTFLIDQILFWIGLTVYFLCMPYTIYLIMCITNSEIISLPISFRNRAFLIILIIAACSFVMGVNNHLFLTCYDFKVSGNEVPSNCSPP